MKLAHRLMLSLLSTAAHAADVPDETHLHFRQKVAVQGWTTGAISLTEASVRTPLHRSNSVLFRNTYAGIGARVALTPAFSEVGAQATVAPIDAFDLGVRTSYVHYYGVGTGLLPMEGPFDKLTRRRNARTDEALTGSALWTVFTPTLKAKLGPVIFVDGWEISYLHLLPGEEVEGPVYEPFRDLVVSQIDWAFEHQALVLIEALPGGEQPLLRVGPSMRQRFSVGGKDQSIGVGATAMVQPVPSNRAVPSIAGQMLWYVVDADRVEPGVPYMGLALDWKIDTRLRRPGVL